MFRALARIPRGEPASRATFVRPTGRSATPVDEPRLGRLESMSAATAIIRAHQLVLAGIDRVLRPYGLTFSRYEALVLLSFTRAGALPSRQDGPAPDGAPHEHHQHDRPPRGQG